MTLYEINNQIANFIPEVDEETGELLNADLIDRLNMDRDAKIESVALFIKNTLAEAAAIKAERDALDKRMKAAEKQADSMKRYLTSCLNGEKFKSAKAEVSYRKSKRVEVDDEFLSWALQYRRDLLRYDTPKPNKEEIKHILEKGEPNPGGDVPLQYARLVDTVSMTIK